MKPLFIISVLFLISCTTEESPPYHKLQGNWLRVNNSENEKTTELWEDANTIDLRELLKGVGKSYINDSLVFQEKLSIIYDKNDRYFYVVEGVNAEPTYFEISEWTENSFRAYNDWNEFPKFIEYSFSGDSMLVDIGDSSRIVEFNFIRKN